MSMKLTGGKVLPKHRPMFDITKVPTWYYLMISKESGNVYLRQFGAQHGIGEDEKRRSPVPPPMEVNRMKGLIERWNAEGAEQWEYALCSVADLMELQERWDESKIEADKPQGHNPYI